VAAGHSLEVDPARWQAGLEELLGRFGRVEPRRRAGAFVRGLLAELPRKNCWTIAEHVGNRSPDGMQHLLSRAVWDQDGVRDDLRTYLVERLGDPEAVLVIDETGDLKKGTQTVGVLRQYTGTAGRVENAQVAVYLVYASDAGHAVIDRELYLPKGWIDDPARCQAAGVPDQVGVCDQTGPGHKVLTRALEAGVPAAWVTGDEVYGADPALRAELEARGSAMSWWWPATIRWSLVATPTAPTPCSGGFRRGPGSVCRPARAPRATAITTGRSSAWTTATLHLAARLGSAGC
jgi:SRSO17 transposase